jgi:hypothetical protein
MLRHKLSFRLKSFMLLIVLLLPIQAEADSSGNSEHERKYFRDLEDAFLSNFFPPRGAWAFSNGTVEAYLTKDGKLERVRILKHLKGKGKLSKDADKSLYLAVKTSSPVKVPPDSIHCPIKLTIRFSVKDKIHGGYVCTVAADRCCH